MKKLLPALILAVLLSSCGSAPQKEAKTAGQTENGTPDLSAALVSVKFEVKGMTCEGCEKAVVAGIEKLEGIQEASASHTDAFSVVVYDSTATSTIAIKDAIQGAGYEVIGEGTFASAR